MAGLVNFLSNVFQPGGVTVAAPVVTHVNSNPYNNNPFVNYNGKIKQRSVVGDNCFIGSNCNIIAPVVIEKNSYVCAGTTVTNNVKEDDMVIGRVRQQTYANRAHKYLKEMK